MKIVKDEDAIGIGEYGLQQVVANVKRNSSVRHRAIIGSVSLPHDLSVRLRRNLQGQ